MHVRRLLIVDTVSFLTVECGKDLILSFAVTDPDDPTEIQSLILLRTPMYEPLLDPQERGVTVFFERNPSDEEDVLETVYWDENSEIIRLTTQLKTYELDLRKVDRPSITSMRKLLKTMNYDHSIHLSGV